MSKPTEFHFQQDLQRFHWAIENQDFQAVGEFLDRSDRVALMTKPFQGKFPIHRAALSCSPRMLMLLGLEGADFQQRTLDDGKTPLLAWADQWWKLHPDKFRQMMENGIRMSHNQAIPEDSPLGMLRVFYAMGSWIHERDHLGKSIRELCPGMHTNWAEEWVRLGGWEWLMLDESAVSEDLDIGPGLLVFEDLEDQELHPDEMAKALRDWGKTGCRLRLGPPVVLSPVTVLPDIPF